MLTVFFFIFGILFWIALIGAMYQDRVEKREKKEEKRYREEVLRELKDRKGEDE